jgi:hypothetical protein
MASDDACKLGFEGIVSKRKGSPYRSGRSPDWLKFKNPAAPAVKARRGRGLGHPQQHTEVKVDGLVDELEYGFRRASGGGHWRACLGGMATNTGRSRLATRIR